ncbi:putative cathepsin B7 cysteine protease [Monocercomonoides exilis]|nr:putative cathepsin B7 cysteine protease [Monocercomonoides exilis]
MLYFLIASVLAESVVDIVNNDPSSTWVATEYPREILTPAKMRAMISQIGNGFEGEWTFAENENAPASFDCRQKWPGKAEPVRNQGSCGSCWAHAASETMGFRMGIRRCSKGVMSPQDLVSCESNNMGCNGGYADRVWNWIQKKGITTEQCIPYVSGSGRVPTCPSKCKNGSNIVRSFVSSWGSFNSKTVMDEVANNGPVYACFEVFEDFYNYRSGVYQHKTGRSQGWHHVMLMGWGTENGVPYWLLQNSWGSGWGEKGFFRIRRGTNDCHIDEIFYSGLPKC